MENNEREAFIALLRTEFKPFVIKVFNEVSPNSEYLDNWHVDYICNHIVRMIDGKQKRLIINIPPRYLKSIVGSVALPAFILGLNAKASIIAVSYSDDLATKLANDCKRVMETHWYQELFPETRLSKNKKSTTDFETTKGGGRFSTSVNGTLTGRGADWIIIDDPIKPQDANSELMREKVNEWYGNTLYSRLNDKNNGNIIVIMQRLHERDLTGFLLETDNSYLHIKIPAIAEKNEARIISKAGHFYRRQQGEALHPERESLEKLLQAKEYMGEYAFAGQYQQNPAPREGGIIKKKWLKFYSKDELFAAIKRGEIKIYRIINSWDTAYKVEEHNDYSACVTLLVDKDENYYVLDIFRKKLEFPELAATVKAIHDKTKKLFNNSVEILVENKGSGISLIQQLRRDKSLSPRRIDPEADKETRLMSVSHLLESGRCKFPDDNPDWWRDFEQELLRFPKVKHDDQCDALSQALASRRPPMGAFCA